MTARKPTDAELGLTEVQVRRILASSAIPWADFEKWFRGQTHAIDSRRRRRYYRWDVARFIAGRRVALYPK